MTPHYSDDRVTLWHGDCRAVLATLDDASVDSCVTDPPYELGFMGKRWDASGIAYDTNVWSQVQRVLKPGGHLLAFGGTRTYHRMAAAIEHVGFEIGDSIHWLYGSGFPKSLDVSKAIDKAAGAERPVVATDTKARSTSGSSALPTVGGSTIYKTWDVTVPATEAAATWDGWGTALKPAHEPIVVARRAGVLAAGGSGDGMSFRYVAKPGRAERDAGLHDIESRAGIRSNAPRNSEAEKTAVRLNNHPTVKPLELIRWLVQLVTPRGGIVLDPFAGSGTTLEAAIVEHRHAIGIELTDDYLPIIVGRITKPMPQTFEVT